MVSSEFETKPAQNKDQNINDFTLPPLSSQEITHCSFDFWYPKFKNASLRAKIINLDDSKTLSADGNSFSQEIVNYLASEGSIIIPERFINETQNRKAKSEDSDEDLDLNTLNLSQESDSDSEAEFSDFSFLDELNTLVAPAFQLFSNGIFPKLNWSSPKDALWISPTRTLRCRDLGDILLLLKSSDDIAHDLNHAYSACYDREKNTQAKPILVLKEWVNLNPAMEFRCFVINQKLIGVSQRDTNPYPFLIEMVSNNWVMETILNFIEETVIPNFPSHHFVVDLYVVHSSKKIKIVDFNPACQYTHPLLFTWTDLLQQAAANTNTPLWRVIKDDTHSQLARSNRVVSNQFPTDLTSNHPSELADTINKIASYNK